MARNTRPARKGGPFAWRGNALTESVLLGAVRLSSDEASKKKEALYYFVDSGLPGIDFNREIIKPGQAEDYPDGALAIRADDDFWIVAVLPIQYKSWPLEKIVETLWPEYAKDAKYTPDADTPERAIYEANCYGASERRRAEWLEKDNSRLRDENERLRTQRPAPRERYSARAYASNNYFIRQYEHLLAATAHAFSPRPEDRLKGVCIECGMGSSERVHHPNWIARRQAREQNPGGDNMHVKSLCEFDE